MNGRGRKGDRRARSTTVAATVGGFKVGDTLVAIFGVNRPGKPRVQFHQPLAPRLLLVSSWETGRKAERMRPKLYRNLRTNPHGELAQDNEPMTFDYLRAEMDTVVDAVAAMEAYANEAVPDGATRTVPVPNGRPKTLGYEKLVKENTRAKLREHLPDLLNVSGLPSDLDEALEDLMELRHRIAHAKRNDSRDPYLEGGSLWEALVLADYPRPAMTAGAIIAHFDAGMVPADIRAAIEKQRR
ncbi:MAG: hypothetical protein JWM86_2860 [Thermoleophilia bacterium]|nr:hypothetical protein [Thermoleophilia bacterium]